MQNANVASNLRKSQGQQELGRGSSPLAQQMQSGNNGSRENVDAFSGLRINTTPNGGHRHDVMDLDGQEEHESPDLGGHDMQDEMLEDEDEGEFSFVDTASFPTVGQIWLMFQPRSDEMSSSPSVPDEDIDFEHVYALHTFVATVEGQATVTKGDSLDLLDDSNSYWWLVRVLNTQGVGYIPAENIETPFERLARLNKHRNVDIAGVTQNDHLHGRGSAAAVASIKPPKHGRAAQARAPAVPLGPKAVNFAAPTYFEHSGGEYSEEDSQDEYSFEGSDDQHMHVEHGAFSDEDDSERTTDEDGSQDPHGVELDDSADATVTDARQVEEQARSQEVRPLQPRTGQVVQQLQRPQDASAHQQQRALSPSDSPANQLRAVGMSVDDMLREQQPNHQYVPHSAPAPLQVRRPLVSRGDSNPLSSSQQSPKTLDSATFEANGAQQGDTRRIVLTPEIAGGNPTKAPQSMQQQRYVPSSATQQRISAPQNSRPLNASTPTEDEEYNEGNSSVASSTGQQASPGRLKKHQPAGSQSSNDTSIDENNPSSPGKRKKGGMFSGLFSRKSKDKDRKNSTDSARTSDETARNATPTQNTPQPSRLMSPEPPVVKRQAPPSLSSLIPQSKNELDDYLEREAKQKQQIEAQQAMYQQYGIRRGPGEQSNQFTPVQDRNARTQAPLGSPQTTAKPRRPGSLIGSPGIPGLEAPELSVLRIFSSESVPVEATFKTVLLNGSTTTPELLKQTLQRFRLPLDRTEDFYLTIREADDEKEDELQNEDKPLVVFQRLADAAHKARLQLPSVKRSSVSSISSISSNLSAHPAIAKLPMNDFSDDSAVKLYLNCKASTPRASVNPSKMTSASNDAEASESSSATAETHSVSSAGTPRDSSSSALGARFAVRLAIAAKDLPDGYVFDPHSTAIVPKLAAERRASQQSIPLVEGSEGSREKYIYFSTGATVTEAIETALDRFAIIGGVVDGGDEVEDKLAKRRSISRVRYGLASVDAQGHEMRLHPSKKLLDCFTQPPMFKQQPASREARRRSVEAAQMLASASDVQPYDPTFYLRCASNRHSYTKRSPSGNVLQQVPEQERPELNRANPSELSVYRTPTEELPPTVQQVQTPTRQEIIAAQRAATRANQNAIISARRNNAVGGVDLTLRDRTTLRSSLIATNADGSNVRYSYIDAEGAETDVSQLIAEEWSKSPRGPNRQRTEGIGRSASEVSDVTTGTDTASFKTAESSSPQRTTDDEAVAALRETPLSIGESRSPRATETDHLLEAMQGPTSRHSGTSSGLNSPDIDDRIERVLARVRHSQDRSSSRHGRTPSGGGQFSPAVSPSIRDSPVFGRGAPSPSVGASRSHSRQESVEKLNNADLRTPDRWHSKQASTSSTVSEGTNSSQYSAGLSNTFNTSTTTVSPGVSARDRELNSRASQRLVYPADLGGVDHLITILSTLHSPSMSSPKAIELQPGAETLFGPDLHAQRQNLIDPDVRAWFDENVGQLLDIEQRLDAVLDQLVPTI